MASAEEIQESEYIFPYHYTDLYYDQYKYVWSIESILKVKKVAEEICRLKSKSILDVGCGDGRLVYELTKKGVTCIGLDISSRALSFAKVFNPGAKFILGDIGKQAFDTKVDAATCIEVIEHLPIADVAGFVKDINKQVTPNGHVIFTVPGINLPLEKKHYQHFSKKTLQDTLSPHYKTVRILGLHKKTRLVGVVKLLSLFLLAIGLKNSSTFKKLVKWHKKILLCKPSKAQRFMAVCTIKNSQKMSETSLSI